MGRGLDQIFSGTTTPGVENHDIVSTGDGPDIVHYYGAAGEAIDNGAGVPDLLHLTAAWQGHLTIDNAARRASVGDQTALTWTSVDEFGTRVDPGSPVSFVGTDADEGINISGTVVDLASSTATIATGGGDDNVRLENYLPALVDAGPGYDSLTYVACHRAYVAMAVSAECLTTDGREVSTALAGIEDFYGNTENGLTVQGSDRADRVSAFAQFVLVRSGPGADRVYATGFRTTQVVGGRGDDRLKGVSRRGVTSSAGEGPTYSGETSARTACTADAARTRRTARRAATSASPRCASAASSPESSGFEARRWRSSHLNHRPTTDPSVVEV